MGNWVHANDLFEDREQTTFSNDLIVTMKELPYECYDVHSVLQAIPSPYVKNKSLIKTTPRVSNEGKRQCEWSLSVEIKVNVKVLYLTSAFATTVRIANFTVCKWVRIVLPENKYSIERLLVTPFVETVEVRVLSERMLQLCIPVFTNVGYLK